MSIITSPNLPITTAPPGQTANLVNPSDISYEVYIAAGVCLPLIIGFASLRYWAKAFIVKKWTWDDCEYGQNNEPVSFFNRCGIVMLRKTSSTVTCALGLVILLKNSCLNEAEHVKQLATIAYTGVICAGSRPSSNTSSYNPSDNQAVTVGKVLGLHGWDITIGNFLNLDGQSVPHQRVRFITSLLLHGVPVTDFHEACIRRSMSLPNQHMDREKFAIHSLRPSLRPCPSGTHPSH